MNKIFIFSALSSILVSISLMFSIYFAYAYIFAETFVSRRIEVFFSNNNPLFLIEKYQWEIMLIIFLIFFFMFFKKKYNKIFNSA